MKKLIINTLIMSSIVFASSCQDDSVILPMINKMAYEMIDDGSSISSYSTQKLIVNIDDIVMNVTSKEIIFNTSHTIKNHLLTEDSSNIVIDFDGSIDFNFTNIGLNIESIQELRFAQYDDFFRITISLTKPRDYTFVKIDNSKIFTLN